MNESTVLFRQAAVEGRIVDVRCDGGVITDLGEPGSLPGADAVIDADGGALLPGLHDHHIHLFALAAARASLDLARVESAQAFDAAVHQHADSLAGERWLRVVGYHETVHGDLDRVRLDALTQCRRIRVQHRTGTMWVMSSAAVHAAGIEALDHPGIERCSDGVPTGRLFGADTVLRDRLEPAVPDIIAVARELAGYGVTGVTDLTPTDDAADVDALAAAAHAPGFPLHVVVTGGTHLPPDAGYGLARGPVKLVVGDHQLPTIHDIVAGIRAARSAGRTIAVHCVTRVALVLALAAWDEAGAVPGDRIEHGALIPLELIDRIRHLGLIVITQPSFIAERGDHYLTDVELDDMPHLWRCGSLLERGVGVAGSTDAPYGHANPWHAIAAASDRRTRSGAVIGPGERLHPQRALQLFLTRPDDPAGTTRQVRIGAPADVCLLDQPLAAALTDPAATTVIATLGRAGLATGR